MISYWYLIAYDIAHPRRLRRVHQKLTAQGYALQNSTFLCQGSVSQMRHFHRQLSSELHPAEDDLRIFPLATQWYLQFWGISPLSSDLRDSNWPAYQSLSINQWVGKVKPVKTHFDCPPLRYA